MDLGCRRGRIGNLQQETNEDMGPVVVPICSGVL
jgi:hypothetical protein